MTCAKSVLCAGALMRVNNIRLGHFWNTANDTSATVNHAGLVCVYIEKQQKTDSGMQIHIQCEYTHGPTVIVI